MPSSTRAELLYVRQELAFRTQYAELAERSRAEGKLLPGTPGSLALRAGTGHAYWYRRYYAIAGLVVVGTLAYMAWLNEMGVKTVAARTQDLDLARRQALGWRCRCRSWKPSRQRR